MAPLRARMLKFGAARASHFDRVRMVEFSGQNGRVGTFSVIKSASQLVSFLGAEKGVSFTLFGMCSGAAASVYAATEVDAVKRLFLWEISPRYTYDRAHRRFYERRFSLVVCDKSFLAPVHPVDLVSRINCPVAFAVGAASTYCGEDGQAELAALTERSARYVLHGVSHFLSGIGAVVVLGRAFDHWFVHPASQVSLRNGECPAFGHTQHLYAQHRG